MPGFFDKTRRYVMAHKIRNVIILIVVLAIGYWLYGITHPAKTVTRYVLANVQTGTVISTVSGSGQISPSDQVIINPKASGQITRVLIKDGQKVTTGQPLAYINATDQYNAVNNAKANLQSAQISLQKLQEPATTLQLTQDQNAVAKAKASLITDQTNLENGYSTDYSDIVSTFLDLPSIQTQLQDVVIGTEASRGSQWNIDYYQNAIDNWDNADALAGRANTYSTFVAAQTAYNKTYADFQLTSQSSSASTIESMLQETYAAVQAEQNALNSANSYIQLYENQIKSHSQNPVPEADTSITSLSSNITKVNSHLSALLADKNQIASLKQAIVNDNASITESEQTLAQLLAGPDTLDVRSSQLSIQQQQNALQQAEDNLANYTITAPFSGTIANLNLHAGDTVSGGTNAATLITTQDIVNLSLNEVDAAKIETAQRATLTFDAIPNLSLTGEIIDVSPLGTVTQGVVSYVVKIGFDTQDPRVKAGMTVNADIQTAVHQNVLTVPASSIVTTGGATYVRAFNPPLTGADVTSTAGAISATAPTQIPVTIGISDNTNTEITSGLTAGQQIVSRMSTTGGTASAASTATTRGGFGGGGGGTAVRI